MKIHAVSGRRPKKDFSDLIFLNDNWIKPTDSVKHYQAKYGGGGVFSALKSITYFEDTKESRVRATETDGLGNMRERG